jgi:hypothetical protein
MHLNKNKLIGFLLLAILSQNSFAVTDAEVFSYAAANYPSLFTGAATSGQFQQYSYQYYPATGNYIAVDTTGTVYILGPVATDGAITAVGPVTAFAAAINSWQSNGGSYLLKHAGVYTYFEERGWASGYWPGQSIQTWSQYDSVVGSTVAQEVSLQLDKLKAMGVNTLTIDLRTADPTATGNFTPPDCNEPPVLGLQFPQPTATELANLPLLFDAAQSKGMKIWLRLVNSHMEQSPPTNIQTWLTAILGAIGQKPALDLVMFDGTTYLVTNANGTQSCGIPAEPPLWLGPTSIPATYVQWAIGYAMSLGIPAQKLSAEAVVGDFFLDSQPPSGSTATDSHLWSPIAVEKTIFDNLGIPASQRTYALSFYEHRKCSDAQSLPCTDTNPHDWADQTLQNVTNVVGSGPRIVATEMGDETPVDQTNWNTQHAMESIVFLLHKYGIDGGAFWRWTSFYDTEDKDTTLASPIKQRGVAFTYNPVQKEILDMGGFHVSAIPNGSFEGAAIGGVPEGWTVSGSGTAYQYLLTQEGATQPEVPSRGVYAMRIITGPASATISASSAKIPVTAATAYTTTANLRFSWAGDPAAGTGPSLSRPQVFVSVLYYQASGSASALRAQDYYAFYQEDSTTGFGTFPIQYTTPGDAAYVVIQFGASRNGLATPITLDVDNVR